MSHIMRVFWRLPLLPRSLYASRIAWQTGMTSSPGTQASSGSASPHLLGLMNPPTRRLKPNLPSLSAGMYARSLMCGCSYRSCVPTTHTFHFLGLPCHHQKQQLAVSLRLRRVQEDWHRNAKKKKKRTHRLVMVGLPWELLVM